MNQNTGPRQTQTDWSASVLACIGPESATETVALQSCPLDLHSIRLVTYAGKQMISQLNSYRYYWYYGPLSGGRDGQAMSCHGLT